MLQGIPWCLNSHTVCNQLAIVSYLLQLFAGKFFLQILDPKHFTGIKFCLSQWAWSNLMVFIVVSPQTNIYVN